MELDMKKDIKSTDKISEGTLHEILLDIKYRLDHLEDMEADNRALMVKLVKQSNSVVKFLSSVDMEPVGDPFDDMKLEKDKISKYEKFKDLKELIDEDTDITLDFIKKEFGERIKRK